MVCLKMIIHNCHFNGQAKNKTCILNHIWQIHQEIWWNCVMQEISCSIRHSYLDENQQLKVKYNNVKVLV